MSYKIVVLTAIAGLFVACINLAHADPLSPDGSSAPSNFNDRFAGKVTCPTAEPCKILTLTQQEEKLLMAPNGILDTAAQARSLDLGQFSVYLKTRIGNAPAGEMPPAPPAASKP